MVNKSCGMGATSELVESTPGILRLGNKGRRDRWKDQRGQ